MEPYIAPARRATDAFVLRSYVTGDGSALASALNGSYDHLRPFLAWAQPETTERGAEDRVGEFRARWLAATDFVVAVESVDGDSILGGSGFHLRDRALAARAAEIGMWIRADAAGCGLGSRVLVEMLRWGFDEWPWERLSWLCDPSNVASIRVAERAGMLRERLGGARGDTLCFAALRSTWTPPVERR